MNTFADCVTLLNSQDRCSDKDVKESIDFIYGYATTTGLHSFEIIDLIECICSTEILGDDTKYFILDRCLLPRGLVDSKCITLILSKLGLPTPLNPYRTAPSVRLQVALAKWVCHIYPWVQDASVFKRTFALWFEYWRYDYLQHWITFILLPSFEPKNVTKWRCKVLMDIGGNPGYHDSRALATLLLEAFSSLRTQSEDMILRCIAQLNANEKRINSLKTFNHDFGFVSKIRELLIRNNVISESTFDDLWTCHCDLMAFSPKKEATNTLSLEQLARNWTTYQIPYDFTALSKEQSNIVWMKFLGDAKNGTQKIRFHDYCISSSNFRSLIEKNPLLIWLSNSELDPSAGMSFNEHKKTFKNLSYHHARPFNEVIIDLCLFVLEETTPLRDDHKRNLVETLVTSHLLDTLVAQTSEGAMLLCILMLRFCSKHASYEHHSMIHALADLSMEQVLAINEPLLISEVCKVLTDAKLIINANKSPTKLVTSMNRCIYYLVGYLWNYNIISEHSVLPNSYWESLRSNQYLARTSFPSKYLYSIPNCGLMSFTFQTLLFERESSLDYDHYNGDFSEPSLKIWIHDFAVKGKWFKEISSFNDFRALLLRLLLLDERYSSISSFLFTFCKSLVNGQN